MLPPRSLRSIHRRTRGWLGAWVEAGPAGAPGSDRLYFAEASRTVSTTSPPNTAPIVDLGGPSVTVNVPANSVVRFRVSYEGQTGPDPYGHVAGVFAEVVDPIDWPDGTSPAIGTAPTDTDFHTYTTYNAGTDRHNYEYLATAGVHTFTLEYEEATPVAIGGHDDPRAGANGGHCCVQRLLLDSGLTEECVRMVHSRRRKWPSPREYEKRSSRARNMRKASPRKPLALRHETTRVVRLWYAPPIS
jgi:hypothetical protein